MNFAIEYFVEITHLKIQFEHLSLVDRGVENNYEFAIQIQPAPCFGIWPLLQLLFFLLPIEPTWRRNIFQAWARFLC